MKFGKEAKEIKAEPKKKELVFQCVKVDRLDEKTRQGFHKATDEEMVIHRQRSGIRPGADSIVVAKEV